MKNSKDKEYYKVLGISPVSSTEEIKSAYRNLARKYHPDVNQGNKGSELKFKEIGEAYEVLIDDTKRKRYNLLYGYTEVKRTTENTSGQSKFQAHKAYTKKSDEKQHNTESTKQESVFDKDFNVVFSEILDGIFKKNSGEDKGTQQSKNQQPPQNGDDITTDITLTITEAHNGAVRTVNVLHTESCARCHSRKFYNGSVCIACEGKGEITQHKKISVKIPPNVKEGSKIRIPNEGNKGLYGGINGDLYLIVHIESISIFKYEDLNVICELPITPSEAALGAHIEVPTIDGFATMRIPPETHSGQKFRLAGHGLVDDKTHKKGDQIIIAKIEIPKNLTQKEIELYKELSRARHYNPREDIINRKKL